MNAFRELLSAGRVTHVPGVFDPLSTTLAVQAGHRAVYLAKAAVASVMMGRPDVGWIPATQIADRAATLGPVLGGLPLLADAGTGFETAQGAVWTALSYERAGIAGVVVNEMHAELHEQAPGIAVVARTDAYAVGGLDAVVEDCRAFVKAGADAVLPAGVGTHGELSLLRATLPGVPLVLTRSESAAAPPLLPDVQLAALGVRLVLHPLAALLAAARAASQAYRAILEEGTAEAVDRMPWAAFTALAEPAAAREAAGRRDSYSAGPRDIHSAGRRGRFAAETGASSSSASGTIPVTDNIDT
ncbi:isocitrate lyase/phosphoenolpyruvate mutase family protein [Actinoplanes sp. LDG1-06]|uniref:Isocitrate lyase/phosphoenolpyruvate mutase family protein n=1 Tax=Paractinoplanes ovalisporus TaxID=2810368 RepID=A0ABS2AF95_9ACTN|nr:isocitrate lyase/phosphoenolpyruvate mutase family protein [Actinoplanes ovalisporus]MBM2618502.1 isocitrate lyase/phosphoenolpyruvate mutase family protein [Actinoplanes ovalisporus]